MANQIPRRMVGMIEAYRAAKKAGKTRITSLIDSFGTVRLDFEQDYCDSYTQEVTVNVLPSTTSKQLKDYLETLKTFVSKGDEQQGIQGTEAMRKTAENLRKQADDWEKKAEEREKEFASRLEDAQAMIDDAIAEEEKAKKQFEKSITQTAKDLEKSLIGAK